ncbi:hypothetical protein G6X34_00940 [Staphylococcus aureus]|nr:hypothetical protein [Staphylococcus aureus]
MCNTLHYDIIPMADGGEGTTDALMHATGATKYNRYLYTFEHYDVKNVYDAALLRVT